MRLLLIVPDGVGIRNYLYSSFVPKLESEGHEVMLYHQVSDSAIKEVTNQRNNIKNIKRIPVYHESLTVRILRESLAFAQILKGIKILNNPTVMKFWTKSPSKLSRRLLYKGSEILGRIFSNSKRLFIHGNLIYERLVLQNLVAGEIKEDLLAFNPDFVLNLHQRSPITSPIISTANSLNIQTGTVIFSWDNVPKGRLISRYCKYFVWSDLMKAELHLLYPEVSLNSIYVVGSPQFEFYFDKEYIIEKVDFFDKYGLDPNKKTVCFSANDLSSPYEANYLEDICEQFSKIPLNDRPQILFRKCPVDKSDRFDKIIDNFRELIFAIDPDWRVEKSGDESFTSIYPSYNDLFLLVNTVRHSDLVINFGSTMAHDFAAVDKPCLYLNYDPVENSIFEVNEIYKFQHFKSMEGLDAVVWLNSKEEVNIKVLAVLKNPELFAKDRKAWMERIVKFPLESCSDILVNSLKL